MLSVSFLHHHLAFYIALPPFTYVAVPDRNRILVHRVFREHQQVQRATALSFRLGRGSYALSGRIRYSCVYIARMSPTISGSSALQYVKLGDALEIRNGIIFDFYSGLPHMAFVMLWLCKWQLTSWAGVNAAVHSVAIGERRKQVINNINNLIYSKWSIAYVAIQGRNWTLFSCVFRPRCRVWSAVVQYFR